MRYLILSSILSLWTLISHCQVQADFTLLYPSDSVGCAPTSVHFQDVSSGAVISWDWDFGDGTSSTDSTPVHYYTQPGLYNISLTVSDGTSSDTEMKPNYVRVVQRPAVGFSINPEMALVGDTVEFTNHSYGTSSFLWNFGGGDTSVLIHPSYVFDSVGYFPVTLVSNTGIQGCDDSTTSTVFVTEESYSNSCELEFHPNPFKSSVRHVFDGIVDEVHWEVYDQEGALVDTGQDSYVYILRIPIDAASGAYMLKVQVGDSPACIYRVVKR